MERLRTINILSRLPKPEDKAYFPKATSLDEDLKKEVLKRTGNNNLLYAIRYGSSVAGDASPTSMVDMILIVENTKNFHIKNMEIAPNDYGSSHDPERHNKLNNSGFNFYYGDFQTENGLVRVKYGIISRENFIKGCNGSLLEKEKKGMGTFGFYVAGRMQKVALRPFFKTEDKSKTMEIEKAINSARIDGIWLALGLLPEKFSVDELLEIYVKLSYIADFRVEKPGKTHTMVEKSREDYHMMVQPILETFALAGLIKPLEEKKWRKLDSPSEIEVKRRLNSIMLKSIKTNVLKNLITVGIIKGLRYELQKIGRSIGG